MTSIRFIIANILVVVLSTILFFSTTTSAFVPINAGPSLDAKKAKIAGIGGVDGIKEIKMGGIGSFKVKPGANKKDNENKKKVVQKSKNRQPMGYRSANANWDGAKNKKISNKPVKKEEKKSTGGGFKMPWSK